MTPEEHYAAAEEAVERIERDYYSGPFDDRLTPVEVTAAMSIALVHATLANAGAHAPRRSVGLAEHDHLGDPNG